MVHILQIDRRGVFLIILVILSNFLLFNLTYPQYSISNTSSLRTIDEVQGKYITSLSGDQGNIGILYRKLNVINNTFATYHKRDKLDSFSIPSSLRPVYLSGYTSLFVNNSLQPVVNSDISSSYETTMIQFTNHKITRITMISFFVDNVTSVTNDLKIEDVRTTTTSILIFCSFNVVSDRVIYLYSVLLKVDRTSLELNSKIIRTDIINTTQSFNFVFIRNNFVFLSDMIIQGSQIIDYVSFPSVETVQAISYKIANDSLMLVDAAWYKCSSSVCSFVEVRGKIINVDIFNQSLIISIINQENPLTYHYPGNSTYPSISTILMHHFALFYPTYSITMHFNSVVQVFGSALAKNSYYYIFDISKPEKLMKVYTNPKHYAYFRLYFKTIGDSYLTIVSKFSRVDRIMEETHFTIIRENTSTNVVMTWIRDYKVILFVFLNLIFVLSVIIIKRKRSVGLIDLYPSS